MKPSLEHLPLEANQSFVVKDFDYAFFPTPWHFHPEYEIVLVTEGTGKRLIGDQITEFQPGDLAFIGPNVPHTYRSDEAYREPGSVLRSRSVVIHFTIASLGREFLELPEAQSVKRLLMDMPGAWEPGPDAMHIQEQVCALTKLQGLPRWLALVELLRQLGEFPERRTITGSDQAATNDRDSERMCNVLEWITSNFEEPLRLKEAAEIAGMNEQAFSRFFSRRTRKTFQGFVQELRLRKASRLLREDRMSVTEICFDCGYNNLSNFNRQFRRQYQLNPVSYRRGFRGAMESP